MKRRALKAPIGQRGGLDRAEIGPKGNLFVESAVWRDTSAHALRQRAFSPQAICWPNFKARIIYNQEARTEREMRATENYEPQNQKEKRKACYEVVIGHDRKIAKR